MTRTAGQAVIRQDDPIPHADRVYVFEHARIVREGEPARFAADVGYL